MTTYLKEKYFKNLLNFKEYFYHIPTYNFTGKLNFIHILLKGNFLITNQKEHSNNWITEINSKIFKFSKFKSMLHLRKNFKI